MATEGPIGRELIQRGQRDDSRPRQDAVARLKIFRTTQNGVQIKTHKLFISGIFPLIFLGHCGQR